MVQNTEQPSSTAHFIYALYPRSPTRTNYIHTCSCACCTTCTKCSLQEGQRLTTDATCHSHKRIYVVLRKPQQNKTKFCPCSLLCPSKGTVLLTGGGEGGMRVQALKYGPSWTWTEGVLFSYLQLWQKVCSRQKESSDLNQYITEKSVSMSIVIISIRMKTFMLIHILFWQKVTPTHKPS